MIVAATGLFDQRTHSDMLTRVCGRITQSRALPRLAACGSGDAIGRESVYGGALGALMVEAADRLVGAAMEGGSRT